MSLFGFGAVTRMFAGLQSVERRADDLAEQTAADMEAAMKAELGTYQPGWKELAVDTQRQRAAAGFSPNDPLLRVGPGGEKLRDAITHWPGDTSGVWNAGVPAESDQAVIAEVQELGSLRGVPPRPFVRPVADQFGQEMGGKVVAVVDESVKGG